MTHPTTSHFNLTQTRCFGGGLLSINIPINKTNLFNTKLSIENMNRIAPNNQLPATHFIEVWEDFGGPTQSRKPVDIYDLDFQTDEFTIAIFLIRENELPTIHNFNK